MLSNTFDAVGDRDRSKFFAIFKSSLSNTRDTISDSFKLYGFRDNYITFVTTTLLDNLCGPIAIEKVFNTIYYFFSYLDFSGQRFTVIVFTTDYYSIFYR